MLVELTPLLSADSGALLSLVWSLYPGTAFDQHKEIWQQIHSSVNGSSLLDVKFVSCLLAEFGKRDEVLAICRCNGVAVAAGFFVRRGPGNWQTFQPSQAPIGLWIQDPNIETSLLLQRLQSKLKGLPLLLAATQIDPEHIKRPQPTNRLRTKDYIETARIRVDGNFDTFWAKRGKNLRQNLKKQRNKLEALGIVARLETLHHKNDIARAVHDYAQLENSGWKSGTGTALTPYNDQGRFYQTMLEGFCADGQGIVYRYWFGDQLVATDLCVHDKGVLIILKTTYDETQSKLSPAMLMHEDILKEVFRAQIFTRIEFYGRVMEWHLRLTDDKRQLYHINYYRAKWLYTLNEILASVRAKWKAINPFNKKYPEHM